jgi:drug/metabolite transporter (DMT)-like permease
MNRFFMTKMRTDINSKATVQGFAAVILWSVTVAFVRSISEQLGPLTGAASLYLVSGAIGIFIQFFKGNLPKTLKKGEAPLVYLFAFAGAVSWASYSILAGKLAGNSSINPVPLFLTVTGTVIFILSINFAESSRWSAGVWVEIGVLAAATLAGYELWDRSMRRGNVTAVAAFSYLTPLFSTLFSAAYLAVAPSVNIATGCVFLISGSVLSWKAVK